MPRVAGSKPGYTFVLRNENNGRYMQDVSITLPSSTTIIKATLAAPQLVPWAYRTTRDSIAGLASTMRGMTDTVNAEELLDMLTDADWLEEILKENKLRPDDVRDERGGQGSKAHDALERLASVDPDDSVVDAQRLSSSHDPFVRAIAAWWLERLPVAIAAERVLPCIQHGYCGSVDLVYYDHDGTKIITDLKTRREGLYMYDSDEFQVDSYYLAYNLLEPEPVTKRTVLLAFDDGTFQEQSVTLEVGAFLKLKAVYDTLQTRKGRR